MPVLGQKRSEPTDMIKRIVAIGLIFLCASAAWMVLGATIFSRTYSSDSELENRVIAIWGAPQNQTPPVAVSERLVPKTIETVEYGAKKITTQQEKVTTALPLDSSQI